MSESLLIASESPCCTGALSLCARNSLQGSFNARQCPSVFSENHEISAKTSQRSREVSFLPVPHSGDSLISSSLFGCAKRANSASNGRSKVSRAQKTLPFDSLFPPSGDVVALAARTHSRAVFL